MKLTATVANKLRDTGKRIYEVNIADLKGAKYNPLSKDLRPTPKLEHSLAVVGQQSPILVDSRLNIIDGHRRVAASKNIGKTHVECVIAFGDRDTLFTEVNTTNQKIDNRGWLFIGRNGGVLPATQAKLYAELKDAIGNLGIDYLIECKRGLDVVREAKKAQDLMQHKSLGDIILSMVANRLSNKVASIMKDTTLTVKQKATALRKLFAVYA